jgi:hypothetical protein
MEKAKGPAKEAAREAPKEAVEAKPARQRKKVA